MLTLRDLLLDSDFRTFFIINYLDYKSLLMLHVNKTYYSDIFSDIWWQNTFGITCSYKDWNISKLYRLLLSSIPGPNKLIIIHRGYRFGPVGLIGPSCQGEKSRHGHDPRSEEHTSELQSPYDLV